MSLLIASDAGGPRRPEGEEHRPTEGRRARARRNAVVLALLAAAFYVGFILYGLIKGVFPG